MKKRIQQYNVIAKTTVCQWQQQEQLCKTTIQTTIQRGWVIVIVIVGHLPVADVDAAAGINPTERVW